MCLLYTFKFTPRLHFNLLRLETKTKWTSTFSNSQVNELAVSCLLEIHGFVHCFKSSPIISSIGNSRLYSKRVVYKSDQALEMRLLIWARVKVKANFHSVQPNKLWVASVVELPELFCYLSAVNITGACQEGVWVTGAEEEVNVQYCHMESRDIMSKYICWLGLRRAMEQNKLIK